MWSDLFKALFEGPIWFRIFSLLLVIQIIVWWVSFGIISKREV